jgi:hypothetical protein
VPSYDLPVEFHSPYVLDECHILLQALIGQNFLGAKVDGLFVIVDSQRIDFRFHAQNHRFLGSKAARRFSSDLIEAEVIGNLNADNGTTRLVVESALVGPQYRMFLAKLALVSLFVLAILLLLLGASFAMSVVVGLAGTLFILTSFWFQRQYDIDKLLDLLKSKLEATLIESVE